MESHNSLALVEPCNAPLRRWFHKICHAEPSIIPELALKIAQNALNDTMGPNGLVPTLVVYEILRRLTTASPQIADQQLRMRALEIARREMETVVTHLRITQEMSSRVPFAANDTIHPGEDVLVFRKTVTRSHGP